MSNYDYNFIIKELVKEFKKQFTYLGEITEKYIIFTVPIEKEVTRIDKNGEKIPKNISYILQVIDRARFMASLLSSLVNNLSECGIKCKYCDYFLEYINFTKSLTTTIINLFCCCKKALIHMNI